MFSQKSRLKGNSNGIGNSLWYLKARAFLGFLTSLKACCSKKLEIILRSESSRDNLLKIQQMYFLVYEMFFCVIQVRLKHKYQLESIT